jgi:hypothetical protein
MGKGPLPVNAEAVEGCGKRRGEIAVGAATGADIDQVEADFDREGFGVFGQCFARMVFFS